MRTFNATGPCEPDRHYMLPPADRLPDLQPLIDEQLTFVLQAPRQTGKTTAMRAFAVELRAKGIAACWATVETAQGFEDLVMAEPLWIDALIDGATELPEAWRPPVAGAWSVGSVGSRLLAFLRAWAGGLTVPLVLLIDEADVLAGQALVSFRRQCQGVVVRATR